MRKFGLRNFEVSSEALDRGSQERRVDDLAGRVGAVVVVVVVVMETRVVAAVVMLWSKDDVSGDQAYELLGCSYERMTVV
jgi:hypothetical protein